MEKQLEKLKGKNEITQIVPVPEKTCVFLNFERWEIAAFQVNWKDCILR